MQQGSRGQGLGQQFKFAPNSIGGKYGGGMEEGDGGAGGGGHLPHIGGGGELVPLCVMRMACAHCMLQALPLSTTTAMEEEAVEADTFTRTTGGGGRQRWRTRTFRSSKRARAACRASGRSRRGASTAAASTGDVGV